MNLGLETSQLIAFDHLMKESPGHSCIHLFQVIIKANQQAQPTEQKHISSLLT